MGTNTHEAVLSGSETEDEELEGGVNPMGGLHATPPRPTSPPTPPDSELGEDPRLRRARLSRCVPALALALMKKCEFFVSIHSSSVRLHSAVSVV